MISANESTVTFSFRKATEQDIPYLVNLRKETMTAHLLEAGLVYDDQQHLARITEHFDDSYLICCKEQAIGLIKIAQTNTNWHIRQLQIAQAFQGKGLGGKLLALLQEKASKNKLPITLNVLYKNPALTLYKRAGFKVIGDNGLEYQMRWQA